MSTTVRICCVLAALIGVVASTAAQTATAEQTAFITSPTAMDPSLFAYSVAISGDRMVIGAPFESSDAQGVDGLYNPGGAPNSGAAYVFVRDGETWIQEAYLKPSNTGVDDLFGDAVDIDGDVIVVGAPEEDGFATGINGNMGDGIGTMESGAAYIFERIDGTWRQVAYVKASNTDKNDRFGSTVTVSGDTVVVGAPYERSNATGINGNQANNSALQSGAAYLYERVDDTWAQRAYIKASNASSVDLFATSVNLSGDTLVVGAPLESTGGLRTGAAYVFVHGAGGWFEEAFLKAPMLLEHERFGSTAAVGDDTLVVSASGTDSAYVFERTGGSWSSGTSLNALVTAPAELAPVGLATSGDRIAVAGSVDASVGPGTSSAGVFVFSRTVDGWAQELIVEPEVTEPGDMFGFALGLSGETLLASAHGQMGNSSDSGAFFGAAYSFEIEPGPWSVVGSALAGVAGKPSLLGEGTLAASSANAVALADAAPSAPSGVFLSLASTPAPFKGGTLSAFPFTLLRFVTTNGAGGFTLPFAMPPGVPSTTQLWVQVAIQDTAAVSGVALSNALRGTTP